MANVIAPRASRIRRSVRPSVAASLCGTALRAFAEVEPRGFLFCAVRFPMSVCEGTKPRTTGHRELRNNCCWHGCLYSDPMILEPVHPIQSSDIKRARERIAKTIVRTPLLRLQLGPDFPDIRLKLENLQPINAYKLRGAANAVASLSEEERKRGVWPISAGNAGQGVAYAARAAGVPSTVVVVETAPRSKLERMKALGARLIPVPYEIAWKALEERSFPGVDGTFVHPFDDDDFIAGHGTMGLEILEDAPDVV